MKELEPKFQSMNHKIQTAIEEKERDIKKRKAAARKPVQPMKKSSDIAILR